MTTFTDQESYDAYTKAFGRKPHSGFRVLLRDPSRQRRSCLRAGSSNTWRRATAGQGKTDSGANVAESSRSIRRYFVIKWLRAMPDLVELWEKCK